MREVMLATLVGLVIGIIFAKFKLPIPAPVNFAGVMGIVGIFLGHTLVRHFFS